MPTSERIVTIPSGDLRLHGILRGPSPAACAVVICDPFAEEKKCAHRPLTDVARALADAGFAVLRFDYRGCGDSEGEFGDCSPAGWIADTLAAVEFARRECGAQRLCLAGLRMGAWLANEAARQTGTADALILWEPITDGKRYVAQNLRRSLIKAMLTEGEGFKAEAVAERQQAEVVDFDGYAVSAPMREQLEAIRMGGAPAFAGPTLALRIGPRDEPDESTNQLAATYPQGKAVGIRLEPFWNRIGLIDVSALSAATLAWLHTLPEL